MRPLHCQARLFCPWYGAPLYESQFKGFARVVRDVIGGAKSRIESATQPTGCVTWGSPHDDSQHKLGTSMPYCHLGGVHLIIGGDRERCLPPALQGGP
jgi:hypothetical protein